ncbi:MAG: substrate-binding domain-containing protein [bacterium]
MKKLFIIVIILGIAGAGFLLKMKLKKLPGNKIVLLCGGSMRAAMEELIKEYNTVSDDFILANYGGSGEFMMQLKNTRTCDIYVCHDPFMEWGAEKGLIHDWTTVASLDIVIAVAKGNPKNILKIQDLAQLGLNWAWEIRNIPLPG